MKTDVYKYQDNLFDIKMRTSIITTHLTGQSTTNYLITEVEFLCIQFRKILELIALSSMVANKEEYSKHHEKFAKHYNARLIIQDLERINPDFYPKPTIQIEREVDGKKIFDLQPLNEGYLTKDEFLEVYEKCGGMLHAENPFGHKRDIKKLHAEFPIWLNKIIKLLNHHNIMLVDGETMVIGLMHGAKDGQVQATEFKVDKSDETTQLREKLTK
jgi:hypothetical protein